MSTSTEPEVILRREGRLGRITLNRPTAINALNHPMVTAISRALGEWADDPTVDAVVLDGSGDRGLCAGGDIRAIYRDALAGGTESFAFWQDEYRLNSQIAHYRKPFVALMDGLVMGGGIGLSAHASHRIVTERTKAGMPEVKIGLVPDVGGTYLLARAPGQTGLHAALTGATLTGSDAIAMHLADHFVPHELLSELVDAINRSGVAAAVERFAVPPPASTLMEDRPWIDRAYNASTVVDIIDNLANENTPQAEAAANTITSAAPLSVMVTFQALRSVAPTATLEQILDQEFRMVYSMFSRPDLIEGIRAQVIDKDKNPRWSPASLADVTPEMIQQFFVPSPLSPFAETAADATIQPAASDVVMGTRS